MKGRLDIDEHGGIRVSDMLKRHEFSIWKVNLQDVLWSVRNCNKKRLSTYRDSDGKFRLKAHQGHSSDVGIYIEDDVELRRIKNAQEVKRMGCVCCHGTYNDNWSQISTQGLKKFGRKHIHFASHPPGHAETISGARGNSEILIYLNINQFLNDGGKLYLSANNVFLTPGFGAGVVPTKYFQTVQQVWPTERKLWPKRKRSRSLSPVFKWKPCCKARSKVAASCNTDHLATDVDNDQDKKGHESSWPRPKAENNFSGSSITMQRQLMREHGKGMSRADK